MSTWLRAATHIVAGAALLISSCNHRTGCSASCGSGPVGKGARPGSSAPGTPAPGASAGTPARGTTSLQGCGAVYYVRADGGNATQCTGRADAPYPGQGTGQACAFVHPFIALAPGGSARLQGGECLVIGKGSYRMGHGAPGAEGCDVDAMWDCVAAAIPSGPDPAHPTRIVGAGFDQGCPAPPQLWGAERAASVLRLIGTRHAIVDCLEITDHSGCVEHHSGGLACQRDRPPFGDWAPDGIQAWDSAGVALRNLNIHGLAAAGVRAGRLTDWSVDNVRLAANGWAGWDGDIEGADSNSGTLRFYRWVVEYNGCGETYPGKQPAGCWAQTAGGYGDGVGTGSTGGEWIIEQSVFRYNTSDGLDLLYHDGSGHIVIDRVLAVGNAGNPIKTRGTTLMQNSVVVSNCGFFQGKSFTHAVDPCRAGGNALSFTLGDQQQADVINSTVYSEGDCLIEGESPPGGAGTIRARNNIFIGAVEFSEPSDRSCTFWSERVIFDSDYNVVFGTKGHPHKGAHDLATDPLLQSADPDRFDAKLRLGSPARDSAITIENLTPELDFDGRPRPQGPAPDRGAYEM